MQCVVVWQIVVFVSDLQVLFDVEIFIVVNKWIELSYGVFLVVGKFMFLEVMDFQVSKGC